MEIEILYQHATVENIFEFNGSKGHEIIIPFECKLSEENMKHDKFPLIEDCFDGQFAQFVEPGDLPIYPANVVEN